MENKKRKLSAEKYETESACLLQYENNLRKKDEKIAQLKENLTKLESRTESDRLLEYEEDLRKKDEEIARLNEYITKLKSRITSARLLLYENDLGKKDEEVAQLNELETQLKIKSSLHSDFNINMLPKEIFINIFKYLDQIELREISSVCKTWNTYAWSPVLWEKVDINFNCMRFRNEAALFFFKKLPSSATCMCLSFKHCYWEENLDFEIICARKRCSHLHTLSLEYVLFSVNFVSLVNLCNDYLPNLKSLILFKCSFKKHCEYRDYCGHSKIEILSLFACTNIGKSFSYPFSKLPSLKNLNLGHNNLSDWFWEEDNISFMHRLKLLNLSCTDLSTINFHVLQKQAVNLTNLLLCYNSLNDHDLENLVFPLLKTVCFGECENITSEGIVSLIKSCESLQDVYVDWSVAASYSRHPFVVANRSKLCIVKAIKAYCPHEDY